MKLLDCCQKLFFSKLDLYFENIFEFATIYEYYEIPFHHF